MYRLFSQVVYNPLKRFYSVYIIGAVHWARDMGRASLSLNNYTNLFNHNSVNCREILTLILQSRLFHTENDHDVSDDDIDGDDHEEDNFIIFVFWT